MPTEAYIGASQSEIEDNTKLMKYDPNNSDFRTFERCPICISDYEDGDAVRLLGCMHDYHSECIDEWLRKKKICPLCQRPIDEFEDPPADHEKED